MQYDFTSLATGVADLIRSNPDSPTSVIAVPGTTSATVSWTTPSSNGGAPITSYTAMATRVGDVSSSDARFSWIAPVATCTVVVATAVFFIAKQKRASQR
jgi:hypothetical protein